MVTLRPRPWRRAVAALLALCLGLASVEVLWAQDAAGPSVEQGGWSAADPDSGEADCACLCACTCAAAQLVALPRAAELIVPPFEAGAPRLRPEPSPPLASPRPHFRPPRV